MAVHEETPVRRRVISTLVENRAGVLSHIAGLFSARGFNIDSLAVGETEDPTVSRMTIVSTVDERTAEQIKKQLNKLIDVIKVQDLSELDFVDRELMLVKFKAGPQTEEALRPLIEKHRLFIVEKNANLIVVECVEAPEVARKIFEIFKHIGIVEIARTGTVALSKNPIKE